MCRISSHAIDRARDRWSIEKARRPEDIIQETLERSELVGEYFDDGRMLQLRLDVSSRRVLVINPSDDIVITVWRTQKPPLALDMYDDVIALHRKRITSFARRIRALEKKFDAERDMLIAERDRLDAEIRELKLQRDHTIAIVDNYQFDLNRLNESKKSTVRSLSHYICESDCATIPTA